MAAVPHLCGGDGRTTKLRLEQWLSDQEHFLCLRRTRVWFPVPWQVFQTLWALVLTDTYSHTGIILKNWGLERWLPG